MTTPITGASTVSPVPPNTEGQSEEDRVREAVDRYWVEWAAALATSDPERGPFRALVEGDAQSLVVGVLSKNRVLNEVSIRSDGGPMPHKTISVEVFGDVARVKQCVVDDAVKIERTTGSTIDASVQGLILEQTLNRRDGHWVISDNQTIEELNRNVNSCAGY